ncbi:MAG: hypothetical protein GX957_14890 [Clostridiaceae bacterium]|nr:hypothetical protein [Clostridiaceae bacterium]
MDEFNLSPTYSSGWKRLYREENDGEIRKEYELKEPVGTFGNNKSIYNNKIAINKRNQGVTPEYASLFEENQKEIMNKIVQLQDEIISMKELLNNIQSNTEIIKEIPHKNTVGSKLSKFFK